MSNPLNAGDLLKSIDALKRDSRQYIQTFVGKFKEEIVLGQDGNKFLREVDEFLADESRLGDVQALECARNVLSALKLLYGNMNILTPTGSGIVDRRADFDAKRQKLLTYQQRNHEEKTLGTENTLVEREKFKLAQGELGQGRRRDLEKKCEQAQLALEKPKSLESSDGFKRAVAAALIPFKRKIQLLHIANFLSLALLGIAFSSFNLLSGGVIVAVPVMLAFGWFSYRVTQSLYSEMNQHQKLFEETLKAVMTGSRKFAYDGARSELKTFDEETTSGKAERLGENDPSLSRSLTTLYPSKSVMSSGEHGDLDAGYSKPSSVVVDNTDDDCLLANAASPPRQKRRIDPV